MKQSLIAANIIHLVSATIKQTAAGSTDTTIRSVARRAGQSLAVEESVAIELKNKLQQGGNLNAY